MERDDVVAQLRVELAVDDRAGGFAPRAPPLVLLAGSRGIPCRLRRDCRRRHSGDPPPLARRVECAGETAEEVRLQQQFLDPQHWDLGADAFDASLPHRLLAAAGDARRETDERDDLGIERDDFWIERDDFGIERDDIAHGCECHHRFTAARSERVRARGGSRRHVRLACSGPGAGRSRRVEAAVQRGGLPVAAARRARPRAGRAVPRPRL